MVYFWKLLWNSSFCLGSILNRPTMTLCPTNGTIPCYHSASDTFISSLPWMLWNIISIKLSRKNPKISYCTVADPGFPVGGGVDLVRGGRGPPRRLCFKNFACQNERIWTRRGGRAPGAPPPRSANVVRIKHKTNVIMLTLTTTIVVHVTSF